MTRAEIVEIDAAAQLGQAVDIPRHDVVGRGGDHRLQHLDRQPFGGQIEAVQLPGDLVHQAGIVQFVPREVHPDRRDHQAGTVPILDRGQRTVENHLSQAVDLTRLLEHRQEIGRGDHAAFRVAPAGQCLEPRDLAGVGGDLRLKEGQDVARVEGRGHVARRDRHRAVPPRRAGREGADGRGRVLPRLLQREFGGEDQAEPGLFRAACAQAEPDRAGHVDHRGVEGYGFLDRGLEAGGQLDRDFKVEVRDRGEADAERRLVGAADDVAGAYGRAQPVRGACQDPVGGRASVAVRELVEIVDGQQETPGRPAPCHRHVHPVVHRLFQRLAEGQAGGAVAGMRVVGVCRDLERPQDRVERGHRQRHQKQPDLSADPERGQDQRGQEGQRLRPERRLSEDGPDLAQPPVRYSRHAAALLPCGGKLAGKLITEP